MRCRKKMGSKITKACRMYPEDSVAFFDRPAEARDHRAKEFINLGDLTRE